MQHLAEERVRALAQTVAHSFADEVEHLEACPDCRAHFFHLASRASNREYRIALSASADRTLNQVSRVAEERGDAPTRLSELLALPGAERDVAVATNPRFQTYALAVYALERCEKAVPYDPTVARMLARLAGQIAARTDPRTCGGSDALIDLEAYALAMEGNALRVSGALQLAAEVFSQARLLQEHSGIDLDLAARIDCLESSLFRDLRQLDKALAVLDRAVRKFYRLRDMDQAARTLLNRANVYFLRGDLQQAVAMLEKALSLSCDPQVTLSVRHNLSMVLAMSGRPRQAHEIFQKTQGLYLQHTDPLTTARRLWVEGLILREIGEDLELAAGLLAEAAAHLTDHGYAFDAALAGLDLALVYALHGETGEVLRIAADLVRLFRVRNVHPEALAALTMVHKAAQQEAVTLAVLRSAAEQIRFTSQAKGAGEA